MMVFVVEGSLVHRVMCAGALFARVAEASVPRQDPELDPGTTQGFGLECGCGC